MSENTTTSEQEVRDVFAAWWDESAAKDIDAVMARIARDIVSFEHDAPLQHLGVDAVRRVCQRGFDSMPGDFRWDVDDLQVVARDDIAVAWGINHMRAREPGGDVDKTDGFQSYSRGTWLFRKTGDEWKVIHQHVSYPYDPETGEAKIDLKP